MQVLTLAPNYLGQFDLLTLNWLNLLLLFFGLLTLFLINYVGGVGQVICFIWYSLHHLSIRSQLSHSSEARACSIRDSFLSVIILSPVDLIIIFLVVFILSVDDELLEGVEHLHLLLVNFVFHDVLEQHQLVQINPETLSRKHLPSSSLDLGSCNVDLVIHLTETSLDLRVQFIQLIMQLKLLFLHLSFLKLFIVKSSNKAASISLNDNGSPDNLILHLHPLLVEFLHSVLNCFFVVAHLLLNLLLLPLQLSKKFSLFVNLFKLLI